MVYINKTKNKHFKTKKGVTNMKTKETKKRNSTVKSIISSALAALLCMTMSLPVFAQPIFPTSPIDDNYSRGNTAAITKHLDTPVGTELPTGAKALTFYFQIEKIGFNNVRFSSPPTVEEQATIKDMPYLIGTKRIDDAVKNQYETLADIPITFDGDDYIYNSPDDISSGTKSIFKETNDLFNGIEWKKPGVYTYEIREIEDKTKDALQTVASNDSYTESMTFSKAVYLLSVWVEDGPDGLHITAIGDIKDIDDNGDKTDGSKVDPTPGGGTDTKNPYSKMKFRNIYVKNNGGPDITNPNNTTLKISKEVKEGGSRTQYFTFDITVTQPALVSGTQTYKAYVMEADGTGSKVVTTIDNYATIDANGLIVFTSGTPMAIKLKHGQWLAFTDLHVGSEFTVKELATPDYSPSCTLTAYSSKNPQLSIYTETITKGEGASLTAPPEEPPISTFGKAYVADNNKSIAEFINTFKLIAPTGIGVDDLPYIVIIGVVLAVAAGYVVFRIRRTPKEQA
jgi:hypothetical protein